MRRVVLWLLGSVALWGALVYLLSRPRTWAWLALFSERVSYASREAYNITKQTEIARLSRQEEAVRRATEPLPGSDDVIDSIRYFLEEKRRRGA